MIQRLLPILGITFIDILGFSLLIPLLPYYVIHFGASAVTVGVLFALFSFCQLISGPIWGNLSDRIGRKGVLVISQIGATIGWAMLGWAPTILWVFIARVIEGCSGGNIGVTQAYVADLVEAKDRARAFGYISATFAAGMALGPALGALLSMHGYAITLYTAAGLQFITLIITLIVLPESRAKVEGAVAGPVEILRTFKNPALSPKLWQKLALSLALYGWFGVMALYFKQQLHFDLRDTYLFMIYISVLNVIVNAFVLGRLSDKIGNRSMSTIGIAALVCALAFVPFVDGVWQLAIMSGFFSIGMAFGNTGIIALISATADERLQGTVLSVTSSLDSFSGICAPPLSTGLLGALGSRYSASSSLVFALVALVLGVRAQTTSDVSLRQAQGDTGAG
ncbi:MAG TPA: MFS transporter [Candidatus Baltobacteraceae bacterium]|nr:MFS transporter [Candidatus Baltobacteraceae bacterium]